MNFSVKGFHERSGLSFRDEFKIVGKGFLSQYNTKGSPPFHGAEQVNVKQTPFSVGGVALNLIILLEGTVVGQTNRFVGQLQ